VAKQACPEGEFVQASALNLPLASGMADVGISFGMLHHLPDALAALRELDRVLKADSVIAMHEPIVTKKIVQGRFHWLQELLEEYAHSEHDGEVPLKAVLRELDRMSYRAIREHLLNTPFRTLAEILLRRVCPATCNPHGSLPDCYVQTAFWPAPFAACPNGSLHEQPSC